jgi:hypothetical protein
MTRSLALLSFAALSGSVLAQVYTPPDPSGFQRLIVEPYYVSDANDAADTDGGVSVPAGSRTYRVFVDLKPGYTLQTIGGFPNHPITFSTSTSLFNNDDRGAAWAEDVNDIHLNKNTVAIDSWLSMGAASDAHWGVLKSADPDGSIVGGPNNDGGSTGTPLLVNEAPEAGIPLTTADGLWNTGSPAPGTVFVGEAPTMFDAGGENSYTNDNFAWAVLSGVEGPDTTNRILIGQFTTDGVLDLCFNFWVGIPDSLVCDAPECHDYLEFYAELLPSDTAGTAISGDNKFTHPTLCFNSQAPVVDCNGVSGGPAQPGSPCDDGNAETTNDTYSVDCACLGEDCLGVPGGNALPGQPCDDGNPDTSNDTWQSGCLCDGTVGLQENELANGLRIHPNPTNGLITIALEDAQGMAIGMRITDLLGNEVMKSDLGTRSGSWSTVLDLGSMARGIYLLQLTRGGQVHTERIIRL